MTWLTLTSLWRAAFSTCWQNKSWSGILSALFDLGTLKLSFSKFSHKPDLLGLLHPSDTRGGFLETVLISPRLKQRAIPLTEINFLIKKHSSAFHCKEHINKANVATTVVVAFLLCVTLQCGVQLMCFKARHGCTHCIQNRCILQDHFNLPFSKWGHHQCCARVNSRGYTPLSSSPATVHQKRHLFFLPVWYLYWLFGNFM